MVKTEYLLRASRTLGKYPFGAYNNAKKQEEIEIGRRKKN